ncbi:MAG: hypothetical protein OEZ36_11315, partial [Spirochaetota bacterium]|nr:hypothetical protein [Spirochaetota bacterium]
KYSHFSQDNHPQITGISFQCPARVIMSDFPFGQPLTPQGQSITMGTVPAVPILNIWGSRDASFPEGRCPAK